MIHLENETCLSNKSDIHFIAVQAELKEGGWERVTKRERPHSESKVFALKKRCLNRRRIHWPIFMQCKEEEVLEVVAPAPFKLLSDAKKEAMYIFLNEVKSAHKVNDV